MSDEMKGEKPFSNEEILKRAEETKVQFYRNFFDVLEGMPPKSAQVKQVVVQVEQPAKSGRPVYGGLFGNFHKNIRT